MDSNPFDLSVLRHSISAGHVEWRRHALERMLERSISRSQVFETLLHGELIEAYPNAHPWPSALFYGRCGSRVIHVVVAFHPVGDGLAIVTTYEPDEEHFEPDLKTRKTR